MSELFQADYLNLFAGFQDQQFASVVTDPPYGVDFQGEDWDAFIPLWLEEARRIARVVVFTTGPTTLWDYPRPDWLACWYRTAAQSRSAQGGFSHWTPIPIYGDCKFKIDTFYTHGMATANANKGIDHPSPKDVNMVCWMIENTSQPGEMILDPFMGSGTTGVACARLGRAFVGIERDPKYFRDAQIRIRRAEQQLSFQPEPA